LSIVACNSGAAVGWNPKSKLNPPAIFAFLAIVIVSNVNQNTDSGFDARVDSGKQRAQRR
jgi:hypothetical protein